MLILVYLGCHSKIPRSVDLNNRYLFSTVLRLEIEDQGDGRLVLCLLTVEEMLADGCSLSVCQSELCNMETLTVTVRERASSLVFPSYKTLTPYWGPSL